MHEDQDDIFAQAVTTLLWVAMRIGNAESHIMYSKSLSVVDFACTAQHFVYESLSPMYTQVNFIIILQFQQSDLEG